MSEHSSSIKIVAGGDIMLGEHPIMVGRGVSTQMLNDRGFSPFSAITDVLNEVDLAFANLECALSDPPPGASPTERECRGPSRGIASLKSAGFSALSIANNHIQQHGQIAFSETVSALLDAGIRPVGLAAEDAGQCQPVDIDYGDIRVRLLGYSLRPRSSYVERGG